MPAGMELFPAASEDQWNWIRRVIDESDYYIVILAGRYGSVSEKTGQSYTEMEYRYAVETGKPVIGFVLDDPKQLPAKHYESEPALREKLNQFRSLVQGKLCKFWTTPADLGAKVSRSLTQLIKQHPAVGWVRANSITPENAREVLKLRREIEELQSKLKQLAAHGPAGTERLAQGGDKFVVSFSYERQLPKIGKNRNTYWVKAADEDASVEVTWDELFGRIAPAFINSVTPYEIVRELNGLIQSRATAPLEKQFPDSRFQNFRILKKDCDTITVQLRALGFIALRGDGQSWELTEYGDAYMTKLLAVHKKSPTTRSSGRTKTRRST